MAWTVLERCVMWVIFWSERLQDFADMELEEKGRGKDDAFFFDGLHSLQDLSSQHACMLSRVGLFTTL